MRFIDETSVVVQGGDGGNGLISWHKEPFKPLGGPDGGRGGSGGAVVFIASESEHNLNSIAFQKKLRAGNGKPGDSGRKDGKDGESLIVEVPVGTQFFVEDNLVADLAEKGSAWVAARGGRGGRGNSFFVSARRQAPHIAEQGQSGQEVKLELKLKHIADVGLIGLPNSGKSTLLSVISKATPKIGDYAFTTLTPQLGVVDQAFLVADIPGLIEDAHLGKGLGTTFLKHIERTKTLVFVVDVTSFDQGSDPLELLENELSAYSEELSKKPRIVFISKADLVDNTVKAEEAVSYYQSKGYTTLVGSSKNMQGIELLKSEIEKSLVNEAA